MSASAILALRQQKYYTCFAQAEINYIFQTKSLSSRAKSLWMFLNNQTSGNKDLKFKMTIKQIANFVLLSARRVQELIGELKSKGFLSSEHSDDGILTFQISLPKEAIDEISQSPNRGEAAKEGARFSSPTGARNFLPPLRKIAPLYNKYNNKNNHMSATHLCEEDAPQTPEPKQAPEQSIALEEGRVLFERKERMWNETFAEIASPRARAQRVNAEFTREELALMQVYSDSITEPTEKRPAQEPVKTPMPQQQLHQHQQPCEPVQINGETYYIEPTVRQRAMIEVPRLLASKQVKGDAGNKPITELLEEVFFYISKAGSMSGEIPNQLRRYNTSRKILKDGNWQRPKGMVRQEIFQREQRWQKEKELERVQCLNNPLLASIGGMHAAI